MSEELSPSPVQQRFNDVNTLHDAGVPLTPEQLAAETGGQPEDLEGIKLVRESQELIDLANKAKERHLNMASMGSDKDGKPIGFALLLEDARKVIARFKK